MATIEQNALSAFPTTSSLLSARIACGALFIIPYALLAAGQQGPRKAYQNERAGYSIAYPENWFPSGITYSNAFELRNYEPGKAHLVPEKERASLSVVETQTADAAEAHAFLEGWVNNLPHSDFTRLEIDGRRAVRIQRCVPARWLGPGASRPLEASRDRGAEEQRSHYMAMFIADGERLIMMEAAAPEGAATKTLDEIQDIEGSIRFDVPRDPKKP